MAIRLDRHRQMPLQTARNLALTVNNEKTHSGVGLPARGQINATGLKILSELRSEGGTTSVEAGAAATVKARFEETFSKMASDPEAFHGLMKQVYGEGYDKGAAESLRQKALQGDFSWLPDVKFLDSSTLQGANGAFDKDNGVVYLSKDLLKNPDLAASTYLEEVGHFIDTQVNDRDTVGDEGEMFRRLTSGENLSKAQIAGIRAENDKGTLLVDGKRVEVEFWKPFKKIKKAFQKVGGVIKKAAEKIGNAAKKVGNAVWNGVKSFGKGLWDGVKSFGQGLWNGIKSFGQGLWDSTAGFLKGIFTGDFKGAFNSLFGGLDKMFLRAPQHLMHGAFNAAEDFLRASTHLLGPAGKYVRIVTDRAFDAARSLTMGAMNTVSGAIRNIGEGAGTFVGGIGKIFQGEFKDGFKDMGKGLLKTFIQTPADAVLMAGGKAVSAIQTMFGLEKPGRRLTGAEIAELRKVYGDSIDYEQVRIKEGFAGVLSTNDRPFCHGNTIYMKNDSSTSTLVHEMGHVWQHQNGGTDYMSEALWSQSFGAGYDWQKDVPGTSFENLEPEQQSEFIEQAYLSGYFTPGDPNHGQCMIGGVDYTAYLEDALKKIRAGDGAP